MSILIVEDDDGVRNTLREILIDEGYIVDAVEDGAKALRYLAEHPAPALILLDLMMPNMDGVEFRNRQLADAALAQIPVVVVSATHTGAAVAEQLGAADYLGKPLSIDELLHVVQNRSVTGVDLPALASAG